MSRVISIWLFDEHCRLHHHANVGMVYIYECHSPAAALN